MAPKSHGASPDDQPRRGEDQGQRARHLNDTAQVNNTRNHEVMGRRCYHNEKNKCDTMMTLGEHMRKHMKHIRTRYAQLIPCTYINAATAS